MLFYAETKHLLVHNYLIKKTSLQVIEETTMSEEGTKRNKFLTIPTLRACYSWIESSKISKSFFFFDISIIIYFLTNQILNLILKWAKRDFLWKEKGRKYLRYIMKRYLSNLKLNVERSI